MELREVKELVNFKTLSEDAESSNLECLFDEDIEIAVLELESKVWKASNNRTLTEEAEEYLENLQKVIRREVLNAIKTLKYKNLEV